MADPTGQKQSAGAKLDQIKSVNGILRSILTEAFGDYSGVALRGLIQGREENEYTKKDTDVAMIRETHTVTDMKSTWKVLRFYKASDRKKEELFFDSNMPVVVKVESLNSNGEIFGEIELVAL